MPGSRRSEREGGGQGRDEFSCTWHHITPWEVTVFTSVVRGLWSHSTLGRPDQTRWGIGVEGRKLFCYFSSTLVKGLSHGGSIPLHFQSVNSWCQIDPIMCFCLSKRWRQGQWHGQKSQRWVLPEWLMEKPWTQGPERGRTKYTSSDVHEVPGTDSALLVRGWCGYHI